MRFNKNYKRGIFLLFLLLIIFSGISIIKSASTTESFDDNNISTSQPDDPYEPNDDFGSARDINSENLKWLKLIQEDDDWFKFDVFSNFNRLIVKVLFLNWEGDIDIELYDQFSTPITGSYSTDDGEFLDYIVSPGTYHLRIYGPNWRQPYELLWDAINSSIVYDDYYEPNNNDIEAGINADLSFNRGEWLSEINGLGIQFDFDYFKIDVDPTNRRLFVEVIFDHFIGNIDIDIYNGTLSWIVGSYSFNHNEFINFELPSSGIYYIVVHGSGARNTYDLRWNTGPVEDNYEPNGGMSQATDLTSYDDWQLSWVLGPGIQREDDWYKIKVDSSEKRLRVNVKFKYAFGDIDIEIYDEWGGWIIGNWEERNGAFIEHDLPSGGIYYIRITGDNTGNIYDFFWEDLLVNGEQVGIDPYEPNDGFNEAYDLRDDEYTWLSDIHGVAVQEYDDWYKIDVTPGFQHLIVNTMFDQFLGTINVELFKYRIQMDELEWRYGNYSMSGDHHIDINYTSVFGIEPGIYFIRVFGDNSQMEYDLWWDDLRTDTRDDDNYEENDDPLSAYDLSSHQDEDLFWVNGSAIQRDNDWYKIKVDTGFEHLFVEVIYDYQEGAIGIAIYDWDFNEVTNNFTEKDMEFINDDLPSNGTYYIRIFGDDSGNIYSLRWETWEPYQEELIPGYDIFILLSAIFGVATVITIKWKRSKRNL